MFFFLKIRQLHYLLYIPEIIFKYFLLNKVVLIRDPQTDDIVERPDHYQMFIVDTNITDIDYLLLMLSSKQLPQLVLHNIVQINAANIIS